MDNRYTYDSSWDRLSTAGRIAVTVGAVSFIVLPALFVLVRIMIG